MGEEISCKSSSEKKKKKKKNAWGAIKQAVAHQEKEHTMEREHKIEKKIHAPQKCPSKLKRCSVPNKHNLVMTCYSRKLNNQNVLYCQIV